MHFFHSEDETIWFFLHRFEFYFDSRKMSLKTAQILGHQKLDVFLRSLCKTPLNNLNACLLRRDIFNASVNINSRIFHRVQSTHDLPEYPIFYCILKNILYIYVSDGGSVLTYDGRPANTRWYQ